MGILLKASITDLGEMEDAPDDAEDMLHATADLGLDTVTSALDLVYDALVPIAAVREVTGLRGRVVEDYRSGLDTPSHPVLGSRRHGEDRAGP